MSLPLVTSMIGYDLISRENKCDKIRGSQEQYSFSPIRGGVKNTRLKAKDTKKPEAKDRLSKDRLSRGQGLECSRPRTQCASVLQKRKKRSSHKNSQILCEILGEEKKGHDLNPFLTDKKIVLSSTKDRAFLKTCRL